MCSQVNASTIDGVTALFNACTVGSVACTEILLENGAKPQSLVYQPSPIHEATSKGKSWPTILQKFTNWLFSVFFVIQVSVTWLCMSYCVGVCETQGKGIPLQKETILHGPFTSKWASVRGPVLRDLSLWEPAFADESHYFWLTV